MKTSEDVRESGLYSNDCCDQRLVFECGDTFWRCPRCRCLCQWEIESETVTEPESLARVA